MPPWVISTVQVSPSVMFAPAKESVTVGAALATRLMIAPAPLRRIALIDPPARLMLRLVALNWVSKPARSPIAPASRAATPWVVLSARIAAASAAAIPESADGPDVEAVTA